MAYLKPSLTGGHKLPARARPPMRPGVIAKALASGAGHRMPRRTPNAPRASAVEHVLAAKKAKIGVSHTRPPHMPFHQNVGRPPVQGFPGMGDIGNNPPWQTQQPGFYDEPPDGPLPSMPPQHPVGGFPGFGPFPQHPVGGFPGFGPFPQHPLDPGFSPGGDYSMHPYLPPNLQDLIDRLRQMGPKPRWEGTMNPGFGRPSGGPPPYMHTMF